MMEAVMRSLLSRRRMHQRHVESKNVQGLLSPALSSSGGEGAEQAPTFSLSYSGGEGWGEEALYMFRQPSSWREGAERGQQAFAITFPGVITGTLASGNCHYVAQQGIL